jgi:ketosteroid isomerase-like protein
MPQENVEVVRRLFAAFDDQDWEAALSLFDPAVEWSPVDQRFFQIYELQSGKIVRMVEFLTRAEALEAAGR